jgi:hypothetical protein
MVMDGRDEEEEGSAHAGPGLVPGCERVTRIALRTVVAAVH